MHARRLSKLVLAVVAGVATSGCALFSETRHKQGQELTDAWGKVDLATQVAAPRKNRQALLDQQLKLEEELWSFSRSRIAEQMVGHMDGRSPSEARRDSHRTGGRNPGTGRQRRSGCLQCGRRQEGHGA